MITKNIEQEFKIEVIASLIENTLLKNVSEDELYELSSFISGETIDSSNFCQNGNLIKKLLLELQPELRSINIKITNNSNDLLDEIDVINIYELYKRKFGETYNIKSIKKCIVKTLKY